MGYNQDSLRGLKATDYNCSVIAMDNAGLLPDAEGLDKTGMSTLQMERNLMKQAHVTEVVHCNDRIRILDFARRHIDGVFITCSRNHFAAVVDGVILNSRKNQIVRWAWKISKKEPENNMFFFEIAIGVFSYVLAKSIWNYVKVRATACNEYPIVWLAKFSVLGGILTVLLGMFLSGIFGALWLILTHQR